MSRRVVIRSGGVSRSWTTAAISLWCATSCSGSRLADPGSRYLTVHNVMRAMGLSPLGSVTQGTLATGQEAKLDLALPASCVAVVALGGAGVEDLELSLVDSERR